MEHIKKQIMNHEVDHETYNPINQLLVVYGDVEIKRLLYSRLQLEFESIQYWAVSTIRKFSNVN